MRYDKSRNRVLWNAHAWAVGFAFLAILAVTPQAQAQTVTMLHSFSGADGAVPYDGLVRDPTTGNLYGTTVDGGAHGKGVVFELDASSDYAETVLHSFSGTDGEYPSAGLVRDPTTGNLYGTTQYGGAHGAGVVFELDASSDYAETVLHSFSRTDGAYPFAGLVRDPTTGNLYGTTVSGGAHGYGVVFELDASSDYAETVLHSFSVTDGAFPYAVLVRDSTTGNLYGTTELGGADGDGVVFELDASSNYAETVLHSFSVTDGKYPFAGLVRDSTTGNLYGTTIRGGAHGDGVVFELDASSNYAETVLHSFSGTDGKYPFAGLVRDSTTGNLYGTTIRGGAHGDGVVFELDASSNYAETVLHSFSGTDGANPIAGLVRDSTTGNLYGTAYGGGADGDGVVFELDASSDYAETVLHSFSGADGAYPDAGLVRDSKTGNLYGTTYRGGADGKGVVFEYSPVITFKSLSAKLDIQSGPPAGFDLYASLTLGSGGSIDPLTEPVTLQIGTYSVTIPPGSFTPITKGRKAGSYAYSGTIGSVSLQVQIVPVQIVPGAGSSYEFKAEGEPVDLTGLVNPVSLTLTIGANTGTAQVEADFQ